MLCLAAGVLHSQTLSLYSGNGQIVSEDFLSTVSLVVQATDSSGKPAPGVSVSWAITQGMGTLETSQGTTDANGLAQTMFLATVLPPLQAFDSEVITATAGNSKVNFFMTTSTNKRSPSIQLITPPIENRSITGAAGSTLPGAVSAQIVAEYGFQQGLVIPNVGLRIVPSTDSNAPTASCNAPAGIALSNSQGIVTCDVVLGPTTGSTQVMAEVGEIQSFLLQLAVTPGTACAYSIAPMTQSFPASGGTGTVNVTAGAGCAWTAASNAPWIAIISGAAGTGNGAVSFSVTANTGTARNGTLAIAQQTFTASQAAGTVGPSPLSITSGTPPAATPNATYQFAFAATGGTPPYTWKSANLPAWLSLSAAGVLSGTAPASGSAQFTVTVGDSAGATQSQTYTIAITSTSSGLTITTTSLSNGTVGTQYQQNLTTSGGCATPFSGPPVFKVAGGSLPPGLSIQNLSGLYAITGTPTAGGTFNVTLSATDICGTTVSASFSLTISGGGSGPSVVTFTALPAALSFYVQAGSSAAPPPQAFSLTTNVSSPVNFTAAATTLGGSNWLQLQSNSGTAPGTLNVGITNFATLPPGTYNGNITISSTSPAGLLTVPVTLTVGAPVTLTATPGTITTTLQAGTTSSGLMLFVGSTGGQLHFAVNSNATWLTTTPNGGDTPATLTVNVSAIGLAAGNYNGQLVISSVSASQVVTVMLTVTPAPQPPGPAIVSVVNAATLLPGALVPGELIAIKGSGLGPTIPAGLVLNPDNTLSNSVASVSVLVDSLPLPLLYVSDGQINAIVPYEIAGRASVNLLVQYNGNSSNTINMQVTDTSPGIFVIDPSGQGAIENQNGTVNSQLNPADPGSVVTLFGTGAGSMLPLPQDGSITSTNDVLIVAPVHVYFAGQDSVLWYQGAAPYEPAGVMQINAQLPDGVHGRTSVAVSIGSQTSPNVFLWVK